MDIQGFFTKKGLLLAAKLAAGSTLKYTRACAGAAETALSASALSQIRQTLSMGNARRNGETAVLPVTLEAGLAGSAYTLKEVGLYAQDPDEGEILYKVYRLTEPVQITPSSRLVLRFYLEETVSQDLNVTVVRASAGLLTEADLDPIYARLEAKSIPNRTETVAAADLPLYLTRLPRLLTENLTINVTAGEMGYFDLKGIYGPGTLNIQADGSGRVVFGNAFRVTNCGALISLNGLHFELGDGATNVAVVASKVELTNCTIDGPAPYSYAGIFSNRCSHVVMNGCTIKNCGQAATAANGSVLVLHNCASSGNPQIGISVNFGGIVLLSGTTDEKLNSYMNSKSGGIIVKSNGTPL